MNIGHENLSQMNTFGSIILFFKIRGEKNTLLQSLALPYACLKWKES